MHQTFYRIGGTGAGRLANRLLYAVAAGALCMPCIAAAQSAQQASPPGSPSKGSQAGGSQAGDSNSQVLSEVVVTAQRRQENIQTVPIAITAISGGALQSKAVTREEDLQYAAPGLQINSAGLTESINIRGIGLASGSPAVANGVATYVDGIFQPPIVSTNLFYDIANVEVLRGPQGTLVGSNSTGGAIFINSQSPQLSGLNGYIEGEAGTFGLGGAQGAINLPVNDMLAFRFAGLFEERGSYDHSVGPTPTTAGALDEQSFRVGMLFRPNSSFQALAKVEVTNRNTGGYAYKPVAGTQFAPNSVPGDYNLDYNSPEKNHELGQLYDLELRYTLPDGIILRSVSGWQNKRISNLYDTDAVADAPGSDLQTEQQFVREREASEEVNILSPTNGPFSWILGGYYQHNLIDVQINNSNEGFPTRIVQPEVKTTTGVFGQTNYKLTPTLELQLGLRYSHYSVSQSGSVVIGAGVPGFPPTGVQVADLSGSESDGAVTGKADLNWQFSHNNLIYVFAARGYKSGGVNSSTSTFLPETVWDYELGWKSTLFDGHVRTQIGAYYNSYNNFQFSDISLSAGQSSIRNFPTTTIKGVEGQVEAKYGDLSFDGGFAYVDSSVGAATIVNTRLLPSSIAASPLPQCATGVTASATCFDYTPDLININGGPALFAPKWTLNVGAEYRIVLPNEMTLTPRLNYAYVDSSYAAFSYSRISDLLPAHGLLSALVTLRKDTWTFEAYATNLTGVVYESGQSGNNAFYGSPREAGVRVTKNY